MRRVKLTLSYVVPSTNYCNSDGDHRLVCRFCEKTKTGYLCSLYDAPLMSNGSDIQKVSGCIRATAGFQTEVTQEPPAAPTIDLKRVMKETIKAYDKAVKGYLAAGLPKAMAEKLAQQDILG